MTVLDESGKGNSFHSSVTEVGSEETKVDREDGFNANSDINNGDLDGQTKETDVETNLIIEENVVPDGGWGWFIILGCFVIRMICGGIGRSHGLFFKRFIERFHQSATATTWVTSLCNTIRLGTGGIIRSHGLFFKRFLERFHQSATATTWVTSLSSTVRLGTGPVVSILCNRFTGRSLVLIGAIGFCASLMISGFAPNQPFLYFSYGALSGLGRSLVLTPLPLLLGHYFEKRRSLAFGLAAAGFSLGGFLITPLVELMFQDYGFTGTFIVLSGLATNVFVCACLFRPIEFQRQLLRKRKREEWEIPLNHLASETDQVLNITSKPENDNHPASTKCEPNYFEKDVQKNDSCGDEEKDDLQTNNMTDFKAAETQSGNLKRNSSTVTNQSGTKKKTKLISLSIVKDIRFLTFLLAAFFNSLPSSNLFLPSLAVSRGLTEFEAAYLVSINAGTDTVFRVLAGLVLDMKVFRDKRPLIFNAMTFLQAVTVFLIPSMWSFASLAVLISIEGAAQGTRNAQRSVIMVDLLGLDKLASSMALTMVAQAAGILLGPTISGLLKDIYDSYDGAFYFGGSAVLAGALIMAGGNIRKIYVDKRERTKKMNNEDESVA